MPVLLQPVKGTKGQRDSPALEMKARPHTARAPQGSRGFQRGSEALPMVGPPWPMRLMVVAGQCLHALIVRFGWVPFFCSKWVPFFLQNSVVALFGRGVYLDRTVLIYRDSGRRVLRYVPEPQAGPYPVQRLRGGTNWGLSGVHNCRPQW